MKQKIFIKTFGCQMNEYNSNRIYDSVKKIGYEKTENYNEANCYLLNTCHIRDKAKEKVYHEIGRVKKIKSDDVNPLKKHSLTNWTDSEPDHEPHTQEEISEVVHQINL